MKETMRAAVLQSVGKITYEERPVPQIKDDQVLVRVKSCGICGSDVHYYQHGRIGGFVVDKPIILGHECAGEVVAIGKEVKNLQMGDLVALEPGVPCGRCSFCREGRYNLCPDVVFMATPPYDGAFVEYVAYPARWCFKLQPGMTASTGALIEPLAVGFHAARQGNATVGQSALILGAGCIGLMTLLALKARGVHEVYIADLVDMRLAKATELGATRAIHAGKEDVLAVVRELTGGAGTDLVFETAGAKITAKQTAAAVKRGGQVVMVGMSPEPEISYDFGALMEKEASLHTVFRYHNLYPVCIDAVSRIPLDLDAVITKTFSFNEIPEALDWTVNNRDASVKVVIDFD